MMVVGFVAAIWLLLWLTVGHHTLSPWVADGFFLGMFGEIVGLANIVVRHLFPQDRWSGL